MVISSVLVQLKDNQDVETRNFITAFPEIEIVEDFDTGSVGLLIEARDSDHMMELSKKITSNSNIASFDIAYYNTELERT